MKQRLLNWLDAYCVIFTLTFPLTMLMLASTAELIGTMPVEDFKRFVLPVLAWLLGSGVFSIAWGWVRRRAIDF